MTAYLQENRIHWFWATRLLHGSTSLICAFKHFVAVVAAVPRISVSSHYQSFSSYKPPCYGTSNREARTLWLQELLPRVFDCKIDASHRRLAGPNFFFHLI